MVYTRLAGREIFVWISAEAQDAHEVANNLI